MRSMTMALWLLFLMTSRVLAISLSMASDDIASDVDADAESATEILWAPGPGPAGLASSSSSVAPSLSSLFPLSSSSSESRSSSPSAYVMNEQSDHSEQLVIVEQLAVGGERNEAGQVFRVSQEESRMSHDRPVPVKGEQTLLPSVDKSFGDSPNSRQRLRSRVTASNNEYVESTNSFESIESSIESLHTFRGLVQLLMECYAGIVGNNVGSTDEREDRQRQSIGMLVETSLGSRSIDSFDTLRGLVGLFTEYLGRLGHFLGHHLVSRLGDYHLERRQHYFVDDVGDDSHDSRQQWQLSLVELQRWMESPQEPQLERNYDCLGPDNSLCTCYEPNCNLDECTYDCHCFAGGCSMAKCTHDCVCWAPGCEMNTCKHDCGCVHGFCKMDSCTTNCDCPGSICMDDDTNYWELMDSEFLVNNNYHSLEVA